MTRRIRGFSLPVTLVMMAIMMLLGVMVVRVVDSSNQVINNITYKQAGLSAADQGAERAIAWLGDPGQGSETANATFLESTQTALGYYATYFVPGSPANDFIDFTGTATTATTNDDIDWWTPQTNTLPIKAVATGAAINGNNVAYVIHRLCNATGAPSAGNCVTGSIASTSGNSKGAGGLGAITQTANLVAYRITTRTAGPKGTVSYVQTIVMKPF